VGVTIENLSDEIGKSKDYVDSKFSTVSGEIQDINTLRTGDADLRFYIATVQDGHMCQVQCSLSVQLHPTAVNRNVPCPEP